MGCVYTYADPVTGVVRYVGKTERSLASRVAEHKYNSRHGRTHLYCWMRSLGQSPRVETLENDPSDINEAEAYWIGQLRAWGFDLVNHSVGGEGQVGLKHTMESKAKIAAALKGRPAPWARENIKKTHEAHRGKKLQGDHLKKVLAGLEKAREAARTSHRT